jgi:serine/threonine protein kinase
MLVIESRPNYKILNKVGSGTFGSVYKIIDTKDNKVYALKKIELDKELEKNINQIENESNILKSINNPNIVRYYDCFREKDSFYILMEFCEYNDLRSFIDKYKQKKELIPESVIRTISREICNGIKEIHSKNVENALHQFCKGVFVLSSWFLVMITKH